MADTVGLALNTTLVEALGLVWRGGRTFGLRLYHRLQKPADPEQAAQAHEEARAREDGAPAGRQPPSSSSKAASRAA